MSTLCGKIKVSQLKCKKKVKQFLLYIKLTNIVT